MIDEKRILDVCFFFTLYVVWLIIYNYPVLKAIMLVVILGKIFMHLKRYYFYWGLHRAAANNDIVQIQTLISKGVKIDVNDYEMETPLHKAAWHNSTDAIEMLIKHEANIDARNSSGNSPLY